ncbi:MAG: hypothetical protein AB8G95_03190 [Anaerolineae bacterium]
MSDFIVLKDGQKLLFSDLIDLVSRDVYFTGTNYEVARFLAEKFGIENVIKQKVLVNTLFFRSRFVKMWCALIWLIRENEIDVVEINSNHEFTAALSEQFLPSDITTISKDPTENMLLPNSMYFRIAVKIVINLLYRIFFIRKSDSTQYVRAWVDVSKQIYEQEFKQARILVYPFILNFRRHFRFLYQTFFVDKSSVSLCGLPYRIKDIGTLVKGYFTKDIKSIIEVEYGAYNRHAVELVALGAETIYTTDEFDPVGIAFNEELVRNGVRVVNTTHGVGVYMPYVAYNDFYVFNQAQIEYYSRYNQVDRYLYRSRQNSAPKFSGAESGEFQFGLVYIYAPFEPKKVFEYEFKIQEELMAYLKKLASKTGTPFYIKTHPNQSETSKDALKSQCDSVCNQWIDIPLNNPVFVHIKSTAYYDLYEIAPVITYKSKFLFPEVYFGETIQTVSKEMFEASLISLSNPAEWGQAVELQKMRVGT